MEEFSSLRRWDEQMRAGLLLSPRGLPERRRAPNREFREHFGFMALMLICCACLVYLMQVLRSILRPFLWALFLVMALTPAVSVVERQLFSTLECLLRCSAAVLRCICLFCCRFVCRLRMCERCAERCTRHPQRRSLLAPSSSAAAMTMPGGPGTLRRREEPQANVIGQGSRGMPSPERGGVCSAGVEAGLEVLGDDHEDGKVKWSPCTRFLVHTIAIAVVVVGVVCVIGGFVLMVIQSVISLQGHWSVYKDGARNFADSVHTIVARVTGSMPKEVAEEIAQNGLVRAESLLSAIVTDVLSNAWCFVLEFLMMALYIAFWLSDPMPIGNKIQELFKRYIVLKGFACLGYGVCVGGLLRMLGVDLAEAFGLAAFLLSFVPEVGSIVAIILPAPVILFDSRLESPSMTLAVAMAAQLGLKFVFANVVEVKLVEADQLMKMHPVIILLAVTFFGFIWGPTGMLLSVPLVAYVKVVLLSDQVPSQYRDPLLVMLEGDRGAPAKYARKLRKAVVPPAPGLDSTLAEADTRGSESPPPPGAGTVDAASAAAAAVGTHGPVAPPGAAVVGSGSPGLASDRSTDCTPAGTMRQQRTDTSGGSGGNRPVAASGECQNWEC